MMDLIGGALMLSLSLAVLLVFLRVFLVQRRLPREEITSVIMWISYGLIAISIGGALEGLHFLTGSRALMIVGGTVFLLGIVLFFPAMLNLRRVLLRFGVLE